MDHNLLGQPVDTILELVNTHLPGPFKPYRDTFEATCRTLLGEYAPDALASLDGFVRAQKDSWSEKLPLMNPFDVLLFVTVYLAIIFLGTIFMKLLFRDGFKLSFFARLHNLFLFTLSLYMCLETLRQAFVVNNYTLFGNPVDHSPKGWGMAKIVWLFYVSKIPEFVDTFIMIGKKNFRQVSFLHVYHHLTIFVIWWLVILMAPGGEAYYSAALNSFIHVIMYGYYFFTSLGLNLSFVKKYITMMQMTQFVTMLIQASYDLYTGGGGYPRLPTMILFFYMITLLILFANYFVKEQARLRKLRQEQKAGGKKKTN